MRCAIDTGGGSRKTSLSMAARSSARLYQTIHAVTKPVTLDLVLLGVITDTWVRLGDLLGGDDGDLGGAEAEHEALWHSPRLTAEVRQGGLSGASGTAANAHAAP
jgi:hypothetical protein